MKILKSFLLLMLVFTLGSCDFINDLLDPNPDEEIVYFSVTVSANQDVEISLTDGPYASGMQVTLIAPEIEGFAFIHFFDKAQNSVLSTQMNYTFTIHRNYQIEAVYQAYSPHDVSLTSSVSAPVFLSATAPYTDGQLITATADDLDGYQFVHWLDVETNLIVSSQKAFAFTLIRSRQLYALYVPSNMVNIQFYSTQEAAISLSSEGPYLKDVTVTAVAPQVDNHKFLYWHDVLTQEILSSHSTLELVTSTHRYIMAVYEEKLAPRLSYETGFEDVTKGTYAEGFIDSNDGMWLLNDAVIGSLANDKKTGNRSVRLKNGFIETLFSTPYVASFSFDYARYGSDNSAYFDVWMKTDTVDWVRISENLLAYDAFTRFTYTLDPSVLTSHSMSETGPFYFKISSNNESRINIDSFEITAYAFEKNAIKPVFDDGSSVVFPNTSSKLTLTFSDDFKIHYSYKDTYNQAGCVAVDTYLQETPCNVYGSVDTSRLGTYQITYYALDDDGEYASTTLTKAVLRDASLLGLTYTGYYQGVEGLFGEALKLALRDIINQVTLPTYEQAKEALAEADVHPTDPTKVLAIYSQDAVARTWDSVSWHREHVWPNSRLGIPRVTESSRNQGSDLHNLRAIVPSVNSSRSNKVFDDVTTSMTYDPGLDRGDVSRILFYMVVMYEALTLVEDVLPNDPVTNYTPSGAYMSRLSRLIVWHFEDPVSDFERHRNGVIYTYQGNRNPFIDYPHFVELIYFDHPALPLP